MNIASSALGVAAQFSDGTNYGLNITGISGGVDYVMNGTQSFRVSQAGGGTPLLIDTSGNLTTDGILSVDDTTESTAGTTGSIHTDGGVGIAKDLFVGGDVGIGQTPTKPFQVYANSGLQFEVHQDIASPTARFMMEGGTALAYQYANGATNTSAAYSVQGVGSHLWYGVSNTGTLRMTLNATGLGIGMTPNGGMNFSVANAGGAYIAVYDSDQGTTGGTDGLMIGMAGTTAYVMNRENGVMNFYTNNEARMTIAAAGTVNVVGTFTAGTKTFRIDHPLPSMTDTHHLLHSSIEGPQADLIYRGRADLVAGTVDVNIDTAVGMTEGTFVLLCGDVQCFTSNEDGWTALKGSVTGNVLTITAQDNTCTDTVSWMVIGERKDAKMIESEWADDNGKLIVETLKSAHE